MEKKATDVVKSKEKNIAFKVCAVTIQNEYNKVKDEFDKMNSLEREELSIKKHIEENGFITIPVEGKSIDKEKVGKNLKKAVKKDKETKTSKDEMSK